MPPVNREPEKINRSKIRDSLWKPSFASAMSKLWKGWVAEIFQQCPPPIELSVVLQRRTFLGDPGLEMMACYLLSVCLCSIIIIWIPTPCRILCHLVIVNLICFFVSWNRWNGQGCLSRNPSKPLDTPNQWPEIKVIGRTWTARWML